MSAPHLSLTALFHRFPDDYRGGTRFVREHWPRGVEYLPCESDNRLHARHAADRGPDPTRPEPEAVRVFCGDDSRPAHSPPVGRVFPQVAVIFWKDGHATLADGCPYLANGQVSLQPMPAG